MQNHTIYIESVISSFPIRMDLFLPYWAWPEPPGQHYRARAGADTLLTVPVLAGKSLHSPISETFSTVFFVDALLSGCEKSFLVLFFSVFIVRVLDLSNAFFLCIEMIS